MPSDDAYDEVFRSQRAPMLRLAYLLCGDHHAAEELVAEVFARALPAHRLGRIDDVPSYLRRALVNQARGRFRRLGLERWDQRRRRDPAPGEGARFEDRSADRDRLAAALRALSARQRAVVVLRFYEDRSESEVADVLGLRVGTVKAHAHRGLARLRSLLDEEEA